jgi:hypothetical protein
MKALGGLLDGFLSRQTQFPFRSEPVFIGWPEWTAAVFPKGERHFGYSFVLHLVGKW